ncbi:hypothetical protein ABBQ38_007093 [Trebouxia sp. C0009 RCD-2024]
MPDARQSTTAWYGNRFLDGELASYRALPGVGRHSGQGPYSMVRQGAGGVGPCLIDFILFLEGTAGAVQYCEFVPRLLLNPF